VRNDGIALRDYGVNGPRDELARNVDPEKQSAPEKMRT
jgi:hypothetical protein